MILCLTHSGDFYTVDIVQDHLEKLGYASFRLNVDDFPADGKMSYRIADSDCYMDLCVDGVLLKTTQIEAVWYRKLWDFKIPPDLDPHYKVAFFKEYQTLLQLFFNQLHHVPWINNMQIDHAVGGDKMMQLRKACQFGLSIPKTIFSNDPQAIREFYQTCRGEMIMKLHGALSKSMSGNDAFLPTTKVSEADLAHLDGITYCPMIFQEYAPKSYELRIIYVDGVFFTGKIVSEREKTDWRLRTEQAMRWEKYRLPLEIQEQIQRMMEHYQLHFGAIDMIRDVKGNYIFLEVNPQGEWGMLQKELGLPIGQTIAEKLVKHIKKHE